jgi:hypothetical protein
MLDLDPELTKLVITDTEERAAAKTELLRLVEGYRLTLYWFGKDGKTLTQGLSKSIKQNLEHLEAAREKVTPILAAPELDESIFPIPYLPVANPLATAVTALDEAIQLYTAAVEQIGSGQIKAQSPTYHLTMGLLALILKSKSTGIQSSRFTSIRDTKWLIRVIHKITGEDVTRAWVAKRVTEFNKVKPARQ